MFGLPGVVIFVCHPYDFFVENQLKSITGWKRHAHARNRKNGLFLFREFMKILESRGYKFFYIDELLKRIEKSEMKNMDLKEV